MGGFQLPHVGFALRKLWRPWCWVFGHKKFKSRLTFQGCWITCRRCTADWIESV